MTIEPMQTKVLVELPLPFAHGLLALIHLMDESVIATLQTAVQPTLPRAPDVKPELETFTPKRSAPVPHGTKLVAEILGQQIAGHSLADLFGNCVDVVDALEPEALERLAQVQTHARRYVARHTELVHIKSPHLETRRTKSGWWISSNVSKPQVTTAMQLLAEAAGLEFGRDIIFPLPN